MHNSYRSGDLGEDPDRMVTRNDESNQTWRIVTVLFLILGLCAVFTFELNDIIRGLIKIYFVFVVVYNIIIPVARRVVSNTTS